MEVMGKQCKSSLKAQVQWSQRGWRKEWPPLRTAQKPLSIPELFLLRLRLTAQKRWPFLGDASYTTLQILRKDVPRTRHTGSPEYGLFKATRIPPTPSLC